MGCDTCIHWRPYNGERRCWAQIDLSGSDAEPEEIPARDRCMACADWSDEADSRRPESMTATKQIRVQGNALVVFITTEAGLMGLGRGDVVEVTIRKK